MTLFGKNIKDLTVEDIKRLVNTSKIHESKTIEYKRELILEKDNEKKEFLFDVTSFANTDGGLLIYGIEEEKDGKGQNTGVPDKIVGLDIDNEDKLKQKIEDIIRTNTEPQINHIDIEFKNIDGKKILILGIPKLFGLPHMVTFNRTNKFYKRKNTGKYLLDVYELNNTFMNNYTILERVYNFRLNRVKEIEEKRFEPNLNLDFGAFIMHILPYTQLNENIIDLSIQENYDFLCETLKPINNTGNITYNLEGLKTSYITNDYFTYAQIFRDCALEYCTNSIFSRKSNENYFLGTSFEEQSILTIRNAFKIFDYFQIEPPYAIFISFINMINAKLSYTKSLFNWNTESLGREKLLFPSIIYNSKDVKLPKIMRNTFNILWQSYGKQGSPSYNKEGDLVIDGRTYT